MSINKIEIEEIRGDNFWGIRIQCPRELDPLMMELGAKKRKDFKFYLATVDSEGSQPSSLSALVAKKIRAMYPDLEMFTREISTGGDSVVFGIKTSPWSSYNPPEIL